MTTDVQSPTALALDPACAAHDMGRGHPESPRRLHALIEEVGRAPVRALSLLELPPTIATLEQIRAVHIDEYVARVEATEGRTEVLDPDTVAGPRSFDAAMRAAGAAVSVVDAVFAGRARNGFALVRPPGHHAEPLRAMGFCLFNNVAVAAAHARLAHGVRRLAIIDFDVHHGNGTQAAFWDDPDTLYVSTHQYPFFPGTGAAFEVGGPNARGATVNVPLSARHGDVPYEAIYGALLPRILEQFRPELLLVSAGFDLMEADPLAMMRVSTDGVEAIATALVAAAERLCDGRIVMLLEGGYDLSNLRDGVTRCLQALSRRALPSLGALDERLLGGARSHLATYRAHYTL